MIELQLPADYEMVPDEVRAAWDVAIGRDQRRAYIVNRRLDVYIDGLGGLGLTLKHIRALGASNLIIDVGAGDACAINELAAHPDFSEGLEFAATGLIPLSPEATKDNKIP